MSDAKAEEVTIPFYVVTKFSPRELAWVVLTTTDAQDVLSLVRTESDSYFITAFYERGIVTYTPDQFMILEDVK